MDYTLLAQQLQALLEDERCFLPNLANASALLFSQLPDLNWAGFYLTQQTPEPCLVLGPFQGLPACIRIPWGKGVCGTAAKLDQVQRIDDVHQFPGHIACDGASNSEIVIPIHAQNRVVGVLDIDSPLFSRFTKADEEGLVRLVQIIEAACDFTTLSFKGGQQL
ncbi:MAG: GAF domain-containing protein [Lachnospiraceae bacterium]|jgi:L-methionine (R)-S-oxide reductase|nr:GAF domain-containing protein [Lachnospiraceae bacterium]